MEENDKEKNWLLESESEKKEILKMSGHTLLKTPGKEGNRRAECSVEIPLSKRAENPSTSC